jgi:hypothetical protein
MTGDSSSSDRGMTGDRRSSSRPASRVTEARKRGRAAGGARGLTEAFVFVHADGAVARPRSAVCGDDMAGEALHAGSHLGEEKREHALGVRVRLPVNCPGRELSTRRQTLPRRACWLLDLRLPEY